MDDTVVRHSHSFDFCYQSPASSLWLEQSHIINNVVSQLSTISGASSMIWASAQTAPSTRRATTELTDSRIHPSAHQLRFDSGDTRYAISGTEYRIADAFSFGPCLLLQRSRLAPRRLCRYVHINYYVTPPGGAGTFHVVCVWVFLN